MINCRDLLCRDSLSVITTERQPDINLMLERIAVVDEKLTWQRREISAVKRWAKGNEKCLNEILIRRRSWGNILSLYLSRSLSQSHDLRNCFQNSKRQQQISIQPASWPFQQRRHVGQIAPEIVLSFWLPIKGSVTIPSGSWITISKPSSPISANDSSASGLIKILDFIFLLLLQEDKNYVFRFRLGWGGR